MTLWRRLPVETGQPFRFVPASPAEIRAAARPHADYEAAMDAYKTRSHDDEIAVRQILDAALGADNE